MPRNGSGTYVQPGSTTAGPSGAVISSSAQNTLITDIGQEITNSLPTTGVKAMAADLPMGGFKITNLGTPTLTTDATTKAYVDAAVGGAIVINTWIGGTTSGGSTAYVLAAPTPASPAFALTAGNRIVFTPGATNTAALTLTVGALTTKNVLKYSRAGLVALTGSECLIGVLAEVIYDGTQFILVTNSLNAFLAATSAQFLANSSNGTVLTTDIVWASAVPVTLTFSATPTWDFNTFVNAKLTVTANITAITLSNIKAGQSGVIAITQGGVGSFTVVWPAGVLFTGGTDLVLSTAAGAIDVLSYYAITTTQIVITGTMAVA